MEGKHQEDFDFKGFWSYKRNIKYESAENIQDFFDRIYAFLMILQKNTEIKIFY